MSDPSTWALIGICALSCSGMHSFRSPSLYFYPSTNWNVNRDVMRSIALPVNALYVLACDRPITDCSAPGSIQAPKHVRESYNTFSEYFDLELIMYTWRTLLFDGLSVHLNNLN